MLEVLIAVAVVWALVRALAAAPVDRGDEEIEGGEPMPIDTNNPLGSLADAWARAEGFYQSGSLAQRSNNPVNIKGTWDGVTGHTPSGIAVFDTPDSGFSAAQSWLARQAQEHPTWTLYQLFAKVLGSVDGTPVDNAQGNSNQEAENVASFLGVPASTPVSSFLGMSND